MAALPESLRIEARDGTLLRVTATPQGERAIRVRLADVSPHLRSAIVSGEDRRFPDHSGVDARAIARAVASLAGRGRVVSGASTITMQVARLLEPRRRTLAAKLVEAYRARQIERAWSKDEILEAYVNLAPLGRSLRGFEAAARYWFGKGARDLAPEEAALLVAMLPAPTRRAPDRAPALARHWRDRVLDRMREDGALGAREHARAVAAPLRARPHPWPFLAPHAADLAVASARGAGGVVRLGIDLALQGRAEAAVAASDGAGVDGVAVVVLDRGSAEIRALVGSRDHATSPLDAARCRRSAGSTLKPFLFALAFDSGAAAPDGLVRDEPGRFGGWTPENFAGDYRGAIRAADALSESRNLPAVRLLDAVGVESFRDVLRRSGVPLGGGELHLDVALGTVAISPLELARAYVELWRDGEATFGAVAARSALSRKSPAPEAIAPGALAWKTGTSSGRRDAWCVGVTDAHVAVVWMGRLDGGAAPDLVGARAAAPLLAAVLAE
jgi:penicillin-binding protein 1C